MEHSRPAHAPSHAAANTCPGCSQELEAERCGHCGVASVAGGLRVRRVLAQSPHGRMYLAETPAGLRVALKEVVFSLVPDAQHLEAFEREAELLRQLDHPQIPRFIASFREGSGVHTRLYLAQQFIEGESLLARLERHRFSDDEATGLAEQVLGILTYLHGRSPQIIHRDIKPANLLLEPGGTVCLVDFGCARDLLRGRTHNATLVGTFGYMPPEQLGGTVDASSDLYALGATLIHLLTRRPPSELLRPGMVLDFESEVNASPALRLFLRRLVAVRPQERFQTAWEALNALRALPQLLVAEESRPSPPSVRRRLALAALAGFALVALASLGVIAVLRGSANAGPLPAPSERISRGVLNHAFKTDQLRVQANGLSVMRKAGVALDQDLAPGEYWLAVHASVQETAGEPQPMRWRAWVNLVPSATSGNDQAGPKGRALIPEAAIDPAGGTPDAIPASAAKELQILFRVTRRNFPVRLQFIDGASYEFGG